MLVAVHQRHVWIIWQVIYLKNYVNIKIKLQTIFLEDSKRCPNSKEENTLGKQRDKYINFSSYYTTPQKSDFILTGLLSTVLWSHAHVYAAPLEFFLKQ